MNSFRLDISGAQMKKIPTLIYVAHRQKKGGSYKTFSLCNLKVFVREQQEVFLYKDGRFTINHVESVSDFLSISGLFLDLLIIIFDQFLQFFNHFRAYFIPIKNIHLNAVSIWRTNGPLSKRLQVSIALFVLNCINERVELCFINPREGFQILSPPQITSNASIQRFNGVVLH